MKTTGSCSARSWASTERTGRRSPEDSGHGFATSGNDQIGGDVRSEDFQDAGADSRCRRCGRDRLRSAIEPRVTLNGDAHSSTVIDAQAGKLVTNIPLGGKPEYGASAGDGKVYANLTDMSEVVEIDAKTANVIAALADGSLQAAGLDGSRYGPPSLVQRLPQRAHGGFRLSDAGKVVATLPIGMGVDGAGYDAASGNAFASNADGTSDGDPSGQSGPVPRRSKRVDADRVAQHGSRSDQPPGVHRFREVRGAAGRRQRPGQATGVAGNVQLMDVESGSSAH